MVSCKPLSWELLANRLRPGSLASHGKTLSIDKRERTLSQEKGGRAGMVSPPDSIPNQDGFTADILAITSPSLSFPPFLALRLAVVDILRIADHNCAGVGPNPEVLGQVLAFR